MKKPQKSNPEVLRVNPQFISMVFKHVIQVIVVIFWKFGLGIFCQINFFLKKGFLRFEKQRLTQIHCGATQIVQCHVTVLAIIFFGLLTSLRNFSPALIISQYFWYQFLFKTFFQKKAIRPLLTNYSSKWSVRD